MHILKYIAASLSLTQGRHHHSTNHFSEYIKDPSQKRSELLQQFEFQLQFQTPAKTLGYWEHPVACGLCEVGLKPLDWFLENTTIRTGLEKLALSYCISHKIEGGIPSVCKGAINTMAGDLLPALAEGIFSPSRVCDEYLGLCYKPIIKELSSESYVSERIASKPDIIKNNDFVNNIYAKIKADPNPREIVRSIQLADIHIDYSYQEGAANECNFPICCRDNGPELLEVEGATGAGQWGDYQCDVPHKTMKNMFEFIASNQGTLKT